MLVVAAVPLLALVAACGGNDEAAPAPEGTPVPLEGRLPPNFPEDFPLFPGLKIRSSSPLADRYIIEATSDRSLDEVVAFYQEELSKGRWQTLSVEDARGGQGKLFRFTAPHFPMDVDGRLLVAEGPEGEETLVGIAYPIAALEGE